MRKINKLIPLPHFNGSDYKSDCKEWNCFHQKYKSIFEEARLKILMEEQDCFCGYTEILIEDEKNGHIDHYKKKDQFPNLTFDWNNYIVSVNDEDFGAKYKDNKYKIQKTEYVEIFNPVTDSVNFIYRSWGEIDESDEKIKKTVKIFNLNCKSLKDRREKLISIIEIYKKNGLSNDDIKGALNTAGFISVIEQELS